MRFLLHKWSAAIRRWSKVQQENICGMQGGEHYKDSKYLSCPHRVKVRQAIGGALPAQEVLLWGVELQTNVQRKLQARKNIKKELQ